MRRTYQALLTPLPYHMPLPLSPPPPAGMRPLMYSEKEAESSGLGWVRTGHHISYNRSYGFNRNSLLHPEITYYVLEWQMVSYILYYVKRCGTNLCNERYTNEHIIIIIIYAPSSGQKMYR